LVSSNEGRKIAILGDGAGLGPSVVHGIMNGHGGRIEVRSRRGEGREFLPLPALETDGAAQPAA
jgi:signal transduction histidine kinase